MGSLQTMDFVVMGAGVAGLRAAVELAAHGQVLVVTKEAVRESNTHYAQGGIAVAMEGDEDVALHLEDTIGAGDGLVCREAAAALVAEGPVRVQELIDWGTRFDRDPAGRLERTREGAHSLPRILHANGDSTGAEISRSLAALARSTPNIHFAEWTQIVNFLVRDGRIVAADLINQHGQATRVACRALLVASGGAGQVYSDSTNPAVATGDGLHLAHEAGAALADMEFYQFHPTAISLPGVPRFLMSEALRGEGALLRNQAGERFMERYHPKLELAPRDIVARANAREGLADGSLSGGRASEPQPVYLDMRAVTSIDPRKRFPGISAFLAKHGLDLSRDLIPVRPAAHYLMGGIQTDAHGRSTLPGLYAAGEVACTGVHGANRLASNSLLEGLVFGARAAQAMLADKLDLLDVPALPGSPEPLSDEEESLVEEKIRELQAGMWAYAGLLRDEAGLRKGLAVQAECAEALAAVAASGRSSRRLHEALSIAGVARAILLSALARTESRGAHYRKDHPQRDDERFGRHSVLKPAGEIEFQIW